ncbi:MAG: tetratricopeptide repeat protein [Terriglobia bacterium]
MASTWTKKCLGWAFALAMVMSAVPLMAQTGGVTGTAKGVDGKNLAGYPILIERQDIKGTYKTKTNKHGSFVYIGLPIGDYKVVLDSPSGQQLFYISKHVGLGDPTEVDFDLAKEKGAQDALAALQAQKQDAALKQAFDQATALFTQQKYEEAAQAFAKTVPLATGKNAGVLLLDEGNSYFKAGDYQKAADTIQEAIAKDPDNKQYHGALAAADVKLGKTQEAEEEFKKAGMTVDLKALAQNAKASKENQEFKNLKQAFDNGAALENEGQYAQAAEMFEKAIPMAKQKNLPVVLSRAADSWDKAKEYDKAVADYQKAIAADPTNAGYMNNLGTIYGHMGKSDLAMQEFDKAAQTDPAGAARYYFNVGAIAMNAGKLDDAAAAFKKATQSDPKYADAYFLEAQALMGKATVGADGKVVAAPGTVEALQSYLDVAPSGKYAASAQQMLQTLTGKVQTKYQKH